MKNLLTLVFVVLAIFVMVPVGIVEHWIVAYWVPSFLVLLPLAILSLYLQKCLDDYYSGTELGSWQHPAFPTLLTLMAFGTCLHSVVVDETSYLVSGLAVTSLLILEALLVFLLHLHWKNHQYW